jgi:sialate O-acetylesterase
MHLRFAKTALLAAAIVICGGYPITAQSAPQSSAAPGKVTLPRVFSDNMVLQQGASVPIWGWGNDGDTVTVEFRNQKVSAVVKNGEWMVKLSNLTAGGPDTLTVVCGNTIKFKNVLVGEVWLASGQSNMEFPLSRSFEAQGDISNSANPMIHLLKVPRTRSNIPVNDISASWTECNPETSPEFSAVEYYFALGLQKTLHVPVGVIESSWGGTPADVWIQSEYLRSKPEYRFDVFSAWAVAQDKYERAMANYQAKKKAAEAKGIEFKGKMPRQPWKPGELFNGMIAPIVGYAMKGALWYQGENNASTAEDAQLYHQQFPDLIRNWRQLWGEGEFPFLLVQLAPFHPIQPQPGESSWASVREAQLNATKILPNVGMAVITDLGNEHNIHPTHKRPVGERLALAARAIAYHQPIEYSGPVLKETKVEPNQIVLTFDHVAGGLVTPDNGPVRGFAICGEDKKFHWATAVISGSNKIMVFSPAVPHPTAVRYGWADYPLVNLWNNAGLPASPFRTDDFELH